MVNFLSAIFLLILGTFSINSYAFTPKSFSIKFDQNEQTYTGKTMKNSGTLDYLFPGNYRIELASPFKEISILTPKSFIKYSPPLDEKEYGTMIVTKSSQYLLFQVIDNFSDGLKDGDNYKVKKNVGSLDLNINPSKQKEFGAIKIVFIYKPGIQESTSLKDVSEIKILKANKLENNYKIIHFEETIFPAKHFEFTPPKKTKITNG